VSLLILSDLVTGPAVVPLGRVLDVLHADVGSSSTSSSSVAQLNMARIAFIRRFAAAVLVLVIVADFADVYALHQLDRAGAVLLTDRVERTARPNLRVETLSSIRFIAHLPSEPSDRAASQLGNASSPLPPRTRGRRTGIVPP
jgi:hypothetical protein